MKKILLLTTCLLGGLVAASSSASLLGDQDDALPSASVSDVQRVATSIAQFPKEVAELVAAYIDCPHTLRVLQRIYEVFSKAELTSITVTRGYSDEDIAWSLKENPNLKKVVFSMFEQAGEFGRTSKGMRSFSSCPVLESMQFEHFANVIAYRDDIGACLQIRSLHFGILHISGAPAEELKEINFFKSIVQDFFKSPRLLEISTVFACGGTYVSRLMSSWVELQAFKWTQVDIGGYNLVTFSKQ